MLRRWKGSSKTYAFCVVVFLAVTIQGVLSSASAFVIVAAAALCVWSAVEWWLMTRRPPADPDGDKRS